MTDVVEFRSPLGLLGSAADRLVLGHYMPHLLRQRNAWLKKALKRATGRTPDVRSCRVWCASRETPGVAR